MFGWLRDLTTRERTGESGMHLGRQAVTVYVPEGSDMAQEAPPLLGVPGVPDVRRQPAQLRHHAAPPIAAHILAAKLAHAARERTQRGWQTRAQALGQLKRRTVRARQ